MQGSHLYTKKKGYKQFLVDNESGTVTKIIIFEHFFNLNFFPLYLVKVLNITYAD